MSAPDLCHKHGISDATLYNWRRKYGGMEVADAKRLKALETENAKLKKMLAEQMMEIATLKETLGNNLLRPGLTEERAVDQGHEGEELTFASARMTSAPARSPFRS